MSGIWENPLRGSNKRIPVSESCQVSAESESFEWHWLWLVAGIFWVFSFLLIPTFHKTFLYIRVCVCVCARMCYVGCRHSHACGGLMSCFPQLLFQFNFLNTGSFTEFRAHWLARLSVQQALVSSHLFLSNTWMTVGAEDPNSGLHACAINASLTDPFL